MKTKILLLLTAAFALFSSCIKDKTEETVKNYTEEEMAILSKTLNLPVTVDDYALQIPTYLGGGTVFADNKQATLGRVLFFDKKLSANESVSCASCHKPEAAFSDDVALSEGFEGKLTERNTLALGAFPSFNAYYGFAGGSRLFWDERAANVMEQSEQTLKNPIEMGMDLSTLYDKLMQYDYYQVLFEKAFPYEFGYQRPEDKILIALQAFVNSIGIFRSDFDKQWEREGDFKRPFSNFTDQENMGKDLFMANCASCHNLDRATATLVNVANNGLDMEYSDLGVGGLSNNQSEKGLFKVPMLRNVALTAPYMHDGRFQTLEEVVEHYSTGIKKYPTLHENLKSANGQPKNLNLSQEEKDALVAFLKTLTDKEGVMQKRYSDPFKS
ncbi:MAG: c-type cytochrome [Lewinellaceae bacterium]|nr:c-type cytochrome [Saprospiraceae bacterium]MCB9336707.1 c-type cytochrome [Lewinellaceae bacterium]